MTNLFARAKETLNNKKVKEGLTIVAAVAATAVIVYVGLEIAKYRINDAIDVVTDVIEA